MVLLDLEASRLCSSRKPDGTSLAFFRPITSLKCFHGVV